MLENNEENVDKTEKKVTEIVNETPKSEETLEKAEVAVNAVETVKEEASEEIDATVAVVDEIEKSMAEAAESDTPKEVEVAVIDYTTLSLEDLVAVLKKTLSNNPVHKIKNQIEGIKSAFNQKFGALIAEKKAAFLEEGGNAIDFQFSSPIKSEYNTLLSNYKKQRDAHYNDLEKQLASNLEKRLTVIEELKELIEKADTKTMYKSFKSLQDTWRAIGPVSKNHYNDTWKIFHHHVERFYDLLHLSNDFRDLDFKHNLEEKLKIILKAEALAAEPDINVAFKELQELHKIWKEDIGPVSQDMRETVWQKFSEVTKTIHDRRHNHFREMRSKYQEIIEQKLVVVDKLNAYDTSGNASHNDWQKSIKEIEALRQEYFNAGKLPYSKSEEVWQKFKAATKKFNSAKNVFYKHEKNDQQDNLKKKIELIELAESLKDSEDWESATNTLKKIQADWKKIGHVPRKFSDDIWKRFKAACNYYFDRFHDQKNALNKEQQAIVDAKKAFLETVKELKEPTKEEILAIINDWRELGKLPRDARHVDGKFNKLIDRALGGLDLDKKEISMLKFTHVIDSLAADEDVRKLDSEQLFVRKKMDEVAKEIQQLENNLGFFSNAKDDNPLVLNVKKRVDDFKEDLAIWKEKLNYIKKLNY